MFPQRSLTLNPPAREKKSPDYVNPFQYHMIHQAHAGDMTHHLPGFNIIHKNQLIWEAECLNNWSSGLQTVQLMCQLSLSEEQRV